MQSKPRSLADFTRISRQRALTEAEIDQVDRLATNAKQTQRRLPLRIARMRVELHALECLLLPRQMAELERIETRLLRERIARIERELAATTARIKGETINV